MRYLDPESTHRAIPQNYNPHNQDTRPRAPRQYQSQQIRSGEEGRWQKGVDARPLFDRQRLDKDLDRYGVRRKDDGRGRDMDNWKRDRGRSRSRERYQNGGGRGRSRSRSSSRSISRERRRSRSPVRSRRSESPPRQRKESPVKRSVSPVMRAESPLRGDRSDAGSDMVMDDD